MRLLDRDEVTRLSENLAHIELNDRKFELRRDNEISSMRANQAMIRDLWMKETVELAKIKLNSSKLEVRRDDKNSMSSNQAMIQDTWIRETAELTASTEFQTKSTRIESDDQIQHSNWICAIQEQLEYLIGNMKEMQKDQEFLLSLWFDSIYIRQETLPKAHLDTFSWIFRGSTPEYTQPIRFVEWLRGNHSIYWIQGKAGSGKSTLMKFLSQHSETLKHLGFWAGHQELITARFYFWNSGSSLQKSQIGLIRSLLFEILRQCPELLKRVRQNFSLLKKDRLVWLFDRTVDWQYEELLQVYQYVVEQNTDSKFCFFIDGLDEYKTERDKDLGHLVKTLKLLASSPSIKICLSSRPWTVFSDAFGSSSKWMIKLEDLTKQDIYRYVSGKLQEHDQYDKLAQTDDSYTKLVETVTQKAQGVFLWVFLVVRDLLEGLTYNDTIRTMHLRLSQFPEDLGSYFQHMIDSIPKFYRRETAQTFRIALAKEEPSLLITYAYFDDITDNPMLSLEVSQKCAPTPLDMAAIIQGKHDTTRRRLDGRCKGLIEVITLSGIDNPIQRYRVDFLDRTVRDFLQGSDDILDFMYEEGGSDSSLWTNLYHAIFLTMRALRQCIGRPCVNIFNSLWDDLLTILYKAIRESSDPALANPILDQALKLGGGSMHHTRLLERACEFGLLQYVQHNLCSISSLARIQVAEEVFPHALLPNPISAEFCPDLVAYLLALGVDLNKSTISNTSSELVRSISTQSQLGEAPDCEIVNPLVFESSPSKKVSRNLISSFKEQLDCGKLSLTQKGISEVMSLLKANGADIDLPIRMQKQPLDSRKGVSKDFQTNRVSWTARGRQISSSMQDLQTGQSSHYNSDKGSSSWNRKRTYKEESEDKQYSFNDKIYYGGNFVKRKR